MMIPFRWLYWPFAFAHIFFAIISAFEASVIFLALAIVLCVGALACALQALGK